VALGGGVVLVAEQGLDVAAENGKLLSRPRCRVKAIA
jgi:hypothetical protein